MILRPTPLAPVLATLAVVAVLTPLPAAHAGPKTKIQQCKCSIRTPNKWYVIEYYQGQDGLEHLVTASPYSSPTENPVPGVQFMRQKLDPGVTVTAQEALSAIGAQFGQTQAQLTGPVESKVGNAKGARLDVTLGSGDKTLNQRYYATVREDGVYIVLISWQNAEHLEDLEDSAKSVDF